MAEALGEVAQSKLAVSVEQTHGEKQTRGATIGGTQVHSIRLPGFVIAFETLFGLPHERLTIRHDAGVSSAPYVHGTLLAVRRVMQVVGLVRGLDRLLFEAERTEKPTSKDFGLVAEWSGFEQFEADSADGRSGSGAGRSRGGWAWIWTIKKRPKRGPGGLERRSIFPPLYCSTGGVDPFTSPSSPRFAPGLAPQVCPKIAPSQILDII